MSPPATALWWLVTLFLGVQLAVLLINAATFPVLAPAEPVRRRRVSLLVPARNEAATLPETLPGLLAQGAAEVIVLDDNSTDDTLRVLQGFAAEHPQLRVLRGEPLPAGWGGKNWACYQLAGAASGELVVFTDADVFWERGALGALLAFAERHDAVYASVWPRQRTHTLFERLTVPLIDLILLGYLPYPAVRRTRDAAFSAGNGQCMLWTRSAYLQVGGHRAFRDEVLEDVRMGQRAKGKGLKVALALGGELLSTRMYRSAEETVAGFSKNIVAAHGGRPQLVASLLLNTLAYTLAWPLSLWHPLWLVPAAMGAFQRALTCFKTRRSPLEAFLQPLMAFPLWRVGWRALLSRTYTWKGRTYGGAS
ncbi:glycosyltransferase [Truepera radiovictrix]|uniref:Glycosyl transferase family 2 n=1 Tax=Truepera radiovictrix (strain DSM 17093 / CIP 108686 / LMG 22925 / RQ-24) TaxID=649638 RepID=D7CS24_TRURR|nr:glycosyltransferase family 2 protein [Truepera radiovictrix]ADI15352.1 glycosyl transferase family 2 [Truepera radiovictrix DSM 17093]WMT56097.1 glycosyltransferase family 2 protein [Truepera radiovictrix]